MKRHILIIPAMLIVFHAIVSFDAAGSPEPDSVVMPWNAYDGLRELAGDRPAERSERFAYEKALYKGSASIKKDEYYIRFTASIVVNTFGDTEVMVPFLSRQLNLESLTVDETQSTWLEQGEYMHVMVPEAGRHTIRAEFTIILDVNRWPRNVYLPLVRIPASEVIIDTPDEEIDAHFSHGASLNTVSRESGDRIHGYVPAAGFVKIRWLKRNQEKEEIPLKMVAENHTYVSLGENGANCKSEIAFRILQGETNFFRIFVPDTVDIIDLVPAHKESGISQWFTEDVENGRMAHVYTAYKQNKSFNVKIAYERTETKSNYGFGVPGLLPQEVERHEDFVAVGSESNVEIIEDGADHVERRDVRFLPPEIKKFARDNALFYYKALDEAFDLRFTVTSHEKATLVKTRIEKANADSVLTESGRFMTKLVYVLKNNQAQFLRLTLPDGAKLLSAFLSGKEVQPAMDGKAFLIPIEKSAEDSFSVEIAFLAEKEPFGRFGGLTVGLPETELPVGELKWRICTPSDFQMIWFGGNIEKRVYRRGSLAGMLFGRVFSESAEIAHAGGKGYKKYKYSEAGLKKRFKKQNWGRTEEMFMSSASQVQVQIPLTGRSYTFESYLVKDFTPEVSIYYIDDTLKNAFSVAVGAVFLILTLFVLVWSIEKDALHARLQNPLAVFATGLAILFAIILLSLFSLGVGNAVACGVSLAAAMFAIFQNRRIAGRYLEHESGKDRRIPQALLGTFLVLAALCFVIGKWAGVAMISIFYIVFQWIVEKVGGLLTIFKSKKKDKKEDKKSVPPPLLLIIAAVSMLSMLSVFPARADDAGTGIKLKDATVNLSWQEVKQLLDKIEQKKKYANDRPKAEYLFGTARITGEITGKFANLKIRVPIAILSDHYVRIPLFDSSTAVTRALLNGKSLALNKGNASVYFEAKREQDRLNTLELDVFIPVREKGGVNQFSLKSTLLRGGLADLSFGKEIKSVKLFGVAWQERKGQRVTAALGRDMELRGELATFLREKEAADETSRRVKKLYSTTYTLVSVEEEIATFYSSIRYKILNDLVREFTIQLPSDVVVHEIVGEDLEKWSMTETENGVSTYRVKVLYPVAFRYDLSVQYEKPVKSESGDFEIPVLQVDGVARDVGYVGIEMQSQAEIELKTLKKARLIDIRELPKIIRADAYSPFVYALRYVERPYEIAFKIQKHENYAMDPAIADRVQYTHLISPRGKVMAQVKMWIRNSRKQYAAFVLPENASVMSAFLDGRSIKPSIGEKGELLLPLKRQSMDPFVLEVVYSEASIEAPALASQVTVRYPKLDIPASIVESDIYIPKNMDHTDPEGDLGKSRRVEFIAWRSQEARDKLNRLAQQQANAPRQQQTLMQMTQQTQADQKPAGTHSLKIALPLRGKKFSMNTLYVPAGVSLRTGFLLYREILGTSLIVVASLLLLGIGAFGVTWKQRSNKTRILAVAFFATLCYFAPFALGEIMGFVVLGAVLTAALSGIGRLGKFRSNAPDEEEAPEELRE